MSIKGIPPCKCARRGCQKQALYIPVVCVPAKTSVIMQGETEVYRAHMNIPLCPKHSKVIEVNELLSDTLAKMFIGQAQARKTPPPDLERVYMVIESMGADGYQMILQAEAAKKKGLTVQ